MKNECVSMHHTPWGEVQDCLQPWKWSTVSFCVSFTVLPPVLWVERTLPQATFSTFLPWKHSEHLFIFDCWRLSLDGRGHTHGRDSRCVQVVCTHCLADACVAYLIDAPNKDPTGEGDVEAEVDQHVPKLAAHTDRPESWGHTNTPQN